jgi:hypothetical protein
MEFPLSGGEQWALDMLMEGMKKLGTNPVYMGLLLRMTGHITCWQQGKGVYVRGND